MIRIGDRVARRSLAMEDVSTRKAAGRSASHRASSLNTAIDSGAFRTRSCTAARSLRVQAGDHPSGTG